jgi:hypothetical protein
MTAVPGIACGFCVAVRDLPKLRSLSPSLHSSPFRLACRQAQGQYGSIWHALRMQSLALWRLLLRDVFFRTHGITARPRQMHVTVHRTIFYFFSHFVLCKYENFLFTMKKEHRWKRRVVSSGNSACHLLSLWYLALWPWRWRRYVRLKRRFTFNGPQSVISLEESS